VIDLRSDTVTRPTEAMRHAMAHAEVGDDVFGDDPTVNTLEAHTAELLGKDAAVFVPTGTQSNLCALLSHCARGDEYIAGTAAHTYRYEAGGGAVLGSIQPQPVRMLDDGLVDPAAVAAAIKPDDSHFARTRLVCLENTHDGKVQTVDRMSETVAVARRHGLATHLDGARLWNAAADLGVEPAAMAEPFDTISVCLSKGLGAPAGSLLVGSSALIADARRWRKMVGGGMRQVGMLAAAGRYALDHHRSRIGDDHTNAAALAAALDTVDGLDVRLQATNMVFVDCDGAGPGLTSRLADHGLLIRADVSPIRLVTHLDVDATDVDRVARGFAAALDH